VSGYLASIAPVPPALAKQHAWQRHWHRVAEVHEDRYVAGCRKPIWRVEGVVTAVIAMDGEVCDGCKGAT
jgi:hypothetical protein